jgi:hypothetical protein
MASTRAAVLAVAILASSCLSSGCGYVPILVVGLAATRAIENATRKPPEPVPTGAGLAIASVSDPPSRAAAGSTFTVRDVTENRGALQPAPSAIRYYLSLASSVPPRADKWLTGVWMVDHRWVTSEGTATVTIPEDTVAGTYRLVACPRQLQPEDNPLAVAGCSMSAGTLSVEAVTTERTPAEAAQQPTAVKD